jgi:hypothetical protein
MPVMMVVGVIVAVVAVRAVVAVPVVRIAVVAVGVSVVAVVAVMIDAAKYYSRCDAGPTPPQPQPWRASTFSAVVVITTSARAADDISVVRFRNFIVSSLGSVETLLFIRPKM